MNKVLEYLSSINKSVLFLLATGISYSIGIAICKIIKADEKKLLLWKILLSIGIILCIISLVLYFSQELMSFNIKDNTIITFLFLGCAIGTASMSMMLHGNIKINKQKVIEYNFKDYKDLTKFFTSHLLENNYKEIFKDNTTTVFKKTKKQDTYIFICAYQENLDEENFKTLYDKVYKTYEKDFQEMQEHRFSKLFVTFIISTNKITPMFNKFVGSNTSERKYFQFPVGYSFGGNKFYTTNIVDGFEEPFQTKMSKEFQKLLK